MNEKLLFNVAHIKMCTEVEGPFKRCCIWFQGCILKCRGCINHDLQEIKANHICTMNQLIDIISSAYESFAIEGITLSGGEPLLQQHLGIFCQKIHSMGLGIILFTGYTEDKIPDIIRNNIDLALTGPYIEKMHDDKRFLIGSSNKKIIEYTKRYHNDLSYFDIDRHSVIEEACFGNNEIFFNGD